MRTNLRTLCAATALLALTACGGGGPDLNSTPEPGPLPVPVPTPTPTPDPTPTPTPTPTPPAAPESGTAVLTVSGSALGAQTVSTNGLDLTLKTVTDASGMNRRLQLSPTLAVLTDDAHITTMKVGPLNVARITSGVLVNTATAVAGLRTMSETRTTFGVAAGNNKELVAAMTPATQPIVPGPQGWACQVNGGTAVEPFMGGDAADYAVSGTATFTLNPNLSVAWKPNLAIKWSALVSNQLTQERFFASASGAQQEADGITQALTIGQRGNGRASVSLAWKIKQVPTDPQSAVYSAITTFSCMQVSGPPDQVPPKYEPPAEPLPTNPEPTPTPTPTPNPNPNPNPTPTPAPGDGTNNPPAESPVTSGTSWVMRGGLGGVPNMIGLANPPDGEKWLTFRPGSGGSDQYADYYANYKGDTFYKAGQEFYVNTQDANGMKIDNAVSQTFGGSSPSLEIISVQTAAMTSDASASPVQWTYSAIDSGPGLFYAVGKAKSPTKELNYSCDNPRVIGARLGVSREAVTVMKDPTAAGGGTLKLSGNASGQTFKERLHVQFFSSLAVQGVNITSSFDSDTVQRDFDTTEHVYEGWSTAGLSTLGYVLVPGEEYLNADNQPRRDVAMLFRAPTDKGLLHGALVMTCRR